MQDINDNDSGTIRDPIEELPEEMFSSVLSFLPPSSIAHSSATSRLWRNTVLSNPTLHQEIDLTRLEDDEDKQPIIHHFQRLSSLSLHKLTKVSLNLTPFVQDWLDMLEFGPFSPTPAIQSLQALDEVLFCLRQSQRTLQEIMVVVGGPEGCHEVFLFVHSILIYLGSLTSLKSIWLEAPIYFSLSTGTSGSTKITVRHRTDIPYTYGSRPPASNEDMVVKIMQEVKKISGSGLTEFLPDDEESYRAEASSKLFKELSDFSSLEKIDTCNIEFSSDRAMWEFVFEIQNLKLLKSFIVGDEDGASALEFEPLRGGRKTTSLNHLDLGILYIEVDWSSVSSWAGGVLEVLKLHLNQISSQGLLPFDFSNSILINSRETLKELSIEDYGWYDKLAAASTSPGVSFPNLEKLRLEHVQPVIYRYFSGLRLPKLHNLTITSTDADASDCLMRNLERCASQLTRLEFMAEIDDSFENPPQCFDFINLEYFKMIQSTINSELTFPKWLLTSLYPSLKKFEYEGPSALEKIQALPPMLKAQGNAPKLELDV